MRTPDRVSFRPSRKDEEIIDAAHAYLRRTRPRAFVSRSDVLRFALQVTERALNEGTAQ